MQPSSCDTFVALPPSTEGQRIIFGKNSDRPSDEVQEVVYFPAKCYGAGEKVECTYIEIDQVAHTYAVVLSRPAWLWGAEMGANENQVCIGNEAVWGRESADGDEALLGMDLLRLGLERADTAEKAVDVITELLEKYGQGGSCMEDESGFTYHNSFLISDRKEAWLLETSGKHWAAERVEGGYRNISNQYGITSKIDKEHPELREYARSKGWWDGESQFNFATVFSFMTTARIEASGSRYCEGKKLLEKSQGHITAETMMGILRDKDSGINMEGMFMTTGSMVSVIPTNPALPGVHYFTATPDPERSVFKPFIFVKHTNPLKETTSPSYGPNDPVKKKPRFQSKPDRKHELFVKHQAVTAIIDSYKDRGKKITESMRQLEKENMSRMEKILSHGVEQPDFYANLFPDAVQEEMAVYTKS
ncbi:secernin-3 [Hippoglossus hippoglossus]|uniref:secernin-3 n=1 Tax=Hippoglossus hippoglossus TaxID=8267 RepID=UPI00148E1CDB|nr:secernin-3 [Hippoglossus hippoglossus]XP_034429929.1 secernin-3 [Hippoglossus hippoglossus]XP_035031102.1 secernin-3 [Hippoglossus stenolepis]XP_035031103.1 secernin-3 [Hippoglossus stenolepis]